MARNVRTIDVRNFQQRAADSARGSSGRQYAANVSCCELCCQLECDTIGRYTVTCKIAKGFDPFNTEGASQLLKDRSELCVVNKMLLEGI